MKPKENHQKAEEKTSRDHHQDALIEAVYAGPEMMDHGIHFQDMKDVSINLVYGGPDMFVPCLPKTSQYPDHYKEDEPDDVIFEDVYGGPEMMETDVERKYCPCCGRKISPEDRFCPECGTRVR